MGVKRWDAKQGTGVHTIGLQVRIKKQVCMQALRNQLEKKH